MKARFAVMVLVGVCLGIPGLADEFVGPFASWANVKTMYNAKGDGITDDTAALQAALNAQGTAGTSDVVYLPAGTYKITATLKQTQKQYVSVVGEDPATTKILWAGPAGGWMLWANGVTYSRWARITWDGANTAGIGVAHKWDHVNNGYATTALEHSDEVFQDMKRGIVGGDPGSNYGWNDAEVSIIRSKFIRNSEAGVSVESWNALNYWIWDSEFTDNARGVTNIFRAGNFHVYRSVFRNSSIADIHILHTSYFSFRGNTSIGSNRFLLAEHIGQNSAAITLQDNKILDTVQADAISDSNVGPLFLIDNVIRSRPGASGPAVTMHTDWATGPDLVSVGNKFTVAAPISVSTQAANARSWAQDDQVVPYAIIDGTIPTLPATPVSMNRRVFEIAPGANSAEIQQAIDQAATLSGQRPVVHLPKGSYSIGTTLSVPANADLQIAGDGWSSELYWTGAAGGTVLRLNGPSRAILREFSANCGQGGNRATGIAIENADQPGARVYLEGFVTGFPLQTALLADGLTYTRIELHGGRAMNDSQSLFVSRGVGGGGSSIVAIFGGMSGSNAGTFPLWDVQNGGRMLVEDTWFEGNTSRAVRLTGTGTFTYWGAIWPRTATSP